MSNYYKLVTANALFNCGRTFIGGFIIASLMMQSISLSTVSIAKAAQLLITVLFTVQAAKFSIRFSNKCCVVLGCIFAILYFMFLTYPSNINVICGEICNGFSLAFYCGSYEAWLFSCSKATDKDSSHKAFALSQELSYFSMALAGLVGAILSNYAITMSIFTILIGSMIALTCDENVEHIKNKKQNSIKLSFFLNKNSLGLFTILSLSYGLMQCIYQYWQPYFKEINAELSFTYLGGIFFFFMIFQSVYSKLTRKYFKIDSFLVSLQLLLCSLILILLSEKIISNIYLASFMFIIFMGLVSSSFNYLFSLINTFINDDYQSIYISYIEAISRLIGFVTLTTYSYLNFLTISWLWELLAFNFLFIAVFLLMNCKGVFVYDV